MRKNRVPPLPPGIRASLFKYPKLLYITTRDYASFGSVCSNILDISVYDGKAGFSLMVYTKFERFSQNDRQMDRWTDGDRQTDRQRDALLFLNFGHSTQYIFTHSST